jgi:hypothetical protein
MFSKGFVYDFDFEYLVFVYSSDPEQKSGLREKSPERERGQGKSDE